MPTFSYKAKSGSGQTVTGVLTAESQQVALRMLDERALFPISVSEGGEQRAALTGRKKKLKLRVLSTFYSQLSDLLRAGVPVLRALEVLSKQAANPMLGEILRDIYNDVSAGETLADSMTKHPNAFNSLALAMVRAGEQGGFLEDVLNRIAVFTERQDELRNKVVGSMIYPCILGLAGVAVVTFLMSYVVPKIKPMLERAHDRPWVTDVVFGLCDGLRAGWMYVVGALVLVIVLAVPLFRSERGQEAMDRLKLRVPVLGGILRMVAICRFCRILGTMLHNGVPILAALKIAKDSAGNRILAAQIDGASENVQRGEPLAKPLGASKLFPPDIVDMIAVAEESNNLENVLVQIADSNEARTARQVDLGVRLLEPLMLMVMAVFVMIIAVALLLPILKMSSAGQ